MSDVARWLTVLDRKQTFRDLAPALAVAATSDFRDAIAASVYRDTSAPGLGAKGHSAIERAIPGERISEMRAAIEALHREGIPPIFAYVYDAFWEPLAALHPLALRELGPYDVLADAWVFRVEPGKRGWRAHRGWAEYEGERTILNVWIALTDTTASTSCMHIVPLDRDPSYPSDLDRLDVPAGSVVALEAAAGTALVWDANALHWGGEMSPTAETPRMSLTFTLKKTSRRSRDDLPLDLGALDFRARLDLIAGEILKYASMEKVAPAIEEWAKLTTATRLAADMMKRR
jgi:hypothetical protein